MLVFENIKIKNFMSFGNDDCNINLEGTGLVSIIGTNLDTPNGISRNGTGKSSIVDAITYVLYGKSIRNVSNPKLVNKLASKGQSMTVTINFRDNDYQYRITRGEKPSLLTLLKKPINNKDNILMMVDGAHKYDISKNKVELTNDIENIIGIPFLLFTMMVVSTTERQQFMEYPEATKRDIVEEIMGLTILTERADILKKHKKEISNKKIAETSELETKKRMNERTSMQISRKKDDSTRWINTNAADISLKKQNIMDYGNIDVEQDIKNFALIADIELDLNECNHVKKELTGTISAIKSEIQTNIRLLNNNNREINSLNHDISEYDKGVCSLCGQSITEHSKDIDEPISRRDILLKEVKGIETIINDSNSKLESFNEDEKMVQEELQILKKSLNEITTSFETLEDCNDYNNILIQTEKELKELEGANNPHLDAIEELKNLIVDIDGTELDSIDNMSNHLDYLIKLLQSKDSFLRKNIINRCIPYINSRIRYYLEVLELQYEIVIQDNFTFDITSLNDSYDWGNLSRGQRQRANIALILTFIDLFELSHDPINLLMIDELLDAGMCNNGAANALTLLEEQCQKTNKSVFIITHREDIVEKTPNRIDIIYENKTSSIKENNHAE